MGLKKKHRKQEEANTPLSAMMDIIFLLIIFFVVTASMDKEAADEKIMLAEAPHGKVLEKQPNNAFVINVRKDGKANINGVEMRIADISNLLRAHTRQFGEKFPIVLRCDREVKHGYIMDVEKGITDVGLYSVRFNAEKK